MKWCSAPWRRVARNGVAAVFLVLLWCDTASAQAVGSASIFGTVVDESGAPMPGVTVSLASPALQRTDTTAVTGLEGNYRFPELPVGVYRLVFDLVGFQSVVQEDVRLTAGFTARVDVRMKIGAIEETIVISGESPVVDVATTTGSVNVTRDVLDTLPMTSAYQVMALSPGVRANNRPEVGGGQLATQLEYRNYGSYGGITPMIEGINTRQSQARHCFFYDDLVIEDSQVKTVGNTAEVGPQGANWVMVVKSGGNEFRGTYQAQFESPRLQANNIDDDLAARGVRGGDALKSFRNFYGDLGGRILRDRLWFFGALRDQRSVTLPVGFAENRGSDGIYGTEDDPQAESRTDLTNQTLKVNYRLTNDYRLVGFVQRGYLMRHASNPTRFRPAEAAELAPTPTVAWKGEMTATPNSRTLLNFMGGYHWYVAPYWVRPSTNVAGNPGTLDRATGMLTGPQRHQSGHRGRYQTTGSATLFPDRFLGGNHNFKIGYQIYWEYRGENYPDLVHNYRLIFDAGRPVEIETFNRPIVGAKTARQMQYSAYITDQWRVGRLTMNLGLRFDRYRGYLKEQTKLQGEFGEGGTFPGRDILIWNGLAPRTGFAYDVRGDGRTVVKGSYGIYRHVLTEDYPQNFNRNNLTVTRYRWSDLDGNRDYTPGEVNLDLNGPHFLAISGARNTLENQDLRQPLTHEWALGIDREIQRNFAVRALYVYKRENHLYELVNTLRPYEAWNLPRPRRDPGPDGILGTGDDGAAVTVWDFDPAYRGARFVGNMFQNRPTDRNDRFHSFEFTATRRMSSRWSLLGAVGATKNHRWLTAIPNSPNDEYHPIDQTWDRHFKLVGTYVLPGDIRLGAFYQHTKGDAGQRTNIFRSADPDGGPSLANVGTVTLRLEPFGESRVPDMKVLNLRSSKRFATRWGNLDVDFDLYNVLNANMPTTQTWSSGPSYGAITNIVPPRIVRVGATFRF